MEHSREEMSYFYRQLGIDFADEQHKLKKNRSQNFNFGVVSEDCICHEDSINVDLSFYTPYGRRTLSEEHIRGSSGEDYLHQHDYYELMYVRSGVVNVNVEAEQHVFHAGDALLINRFSRHLELYDQTSSVIFLCISRSLAQILLADLKNYKLPKELNNFLYQNTEQENIYIRDFLAFQKNVKVATSQAESLLEQIVAEMAALKPGYIYMVKALLLRFFHLLSDHSTYTLSSREKTGSSQDRIFEAVREFIVANNGIITRSQLEQALHFHGDYINKIVKERTGMSLLHFAQTYRMKEAARLLSSTNRSIHQICQQLGFSNKTHFYQLFSNAYHMTPADYRRFSQTHK